MARPGITFLDVKDAIAELQGQEKNITVDHIREVLGTGSRSTINNHLKTWRSQASDAGLNDPTLPSELISLIKGLWENMRSKANDTITQHEIQCDEKMEAVEVKLENTKKALATYEKQQQETSTLLQQKTELAEQLQIKLALEQQETNKLNERITSLETRRQDSVDENKKLHEHIKHLQANLEHYQATIQKQQQEQTLQIEKGRQAQNHIEKELKQQISQLERGHTELNTQKDILMQQVSSEHERNKQLSTELRGTEKQLHQLQAKYDVLEPQHQSLKKHHQETEDALLAKKLEAERLQVELSTQNKLISIGKTQLNEAMERYQQLEANYKKHLKEKDKSASS